MVFALKNGEGDRTGLRESESEADELLGSALR